jgi:hypothetical protein
VTRVDREPYAFEHPGLEFSVTTAGRLLVRIGVVRPSSGGPLYTGNWATEPFPLGWELVAKGWLARNDVKVRR